MKRISIICIFITALAASACKKHRLKGDREVLEGEWEWVETEFVEIHPGGYIYAFKSEDTEGFSASLNFKRNGKLEFYRDDMLEDKVRIVFDKSDFFSSDPNVYLFSICPNNDCENTFGGSVVVSEDSMIFTKFPFEPYGSFSSARNKFIKK